MKTSFPNMVTCLPSNTGLLTPYIFNYMQFGSGCKEKELGKTKKP
ncbi:hypothetical protein GCM10008911_14530 [Ligilactobacillus aviarius]|uniref:Uncharacterized protein n=1 Tax=Ligilactobacillus aviarius TaxID=1606 RepID=A0A510WRL3_9LACO|nr:hypothetical protein LAV01_06960 [Ligilactobacillus aviarius]